MAPVLEQDRDAISALGGLGWKLQIADPPLRLAYLERLCGEGYDSSDRGITVEHGERAAVPHRSQMFAEPGLEIGDADVAHDQL